MDQWLQWWVVTALTGSPLGALLLLLCVWWVLDRFTLGILPDPVRAWARYKRVNQLRRRLDTAPHDRRARFELAELLVEQRRFGAAVEMLTPNVAAGDDDVYTVFLMGVALYGAGRFAEGEKYLGNVLAREPAFRMHAVDLELGRGRLAAGNFQGAKEALERLCKVRPSSVEGMVLLSRALDGLGDAKAAGQIRDQAWKEYAAAPVFQKRRQRWWAWRAKPLRPIAYAVVAVTILFIFMRAVGPAMPPSYQGTPPSSEAPADNE